MGKLSHFDKEGRAHMVKVSEKPITFRQAVARGKVLMQPETLEAILNQDIQKGDVLGIARMGGIMAAKETGRLIPLCHPLSLTGIDIFFYPDPQSSAVLIEAQVESMDRTGVEMEALMAVSMAALTIYDMCKSIDRGMKISEIRLIKKSGGKSGTYLASGGL